MKKIIIFIILISSISSFVFSQDTQVDYNKQLKFYQGQKIAGIVLTCIGGTSLVAGITWGVMFKLYPETTPGTVYLGSSGGSYYVAYYYLNVASLLLNLTGIICLAVGIPVLIVGAVREKKTKRLMETALNKIIPELSFDMYNKSVFIGARIIL